MMNLSLEDLLKKCEEYNIDSTDLSRHDITINIIKKEGGVSKMRVNNQVASMLLDILMLIIKCLRLLVD